MLWTTDVDNIGVIWSDADSEADDLDRSVSLTKYHETNSDGGVATW